MRELRCDICGKAVRTPQGLAGRVRFRHGKSSHILIKRAEHEKLKALFEEVVYQLYVEKSRRRKLEEELAVLRRELGRMERGQVEHVAFHEPQPKTEIVHE
jgi:hypothetical protein